MADATERQSLAEITAERGWSRRVSDRVDIYRGNDDELSATSTVNYAAV